MKNLVIVLSLALGAWTLSPTPVAQASWFSNWWSSWGGSNKTERAKKYYRYKKHRKHTKHTKHENGGNAVPEFDPSAAGSAIVLLLGGVAYIASRRRDEDLV